MVSEGNERSSTELRADRVGKVCTDRAKQRNRQRNRKHLGWPMRSGLSNTAQPEGGKFQKLQGGKIPKSYQRMQALRGSEGCSIQVNRVKNVYDFQDKSQERLDSRDVPADHAQAAAEVASVSVELDIALEAVRIEREYK